MPSVICHPEFAIVSTYPILNVGIDTLCDILDFVFPSLGKSGETDVRRWHLVVE